MEILFSVAQCLPGFGSMDSCFGTTTPGRTTARTMWCGCPAFASGLWRHFLRLSALSQTDGMGPLSSLVFCSLLFCPTSQLPGHSGDWQPMHREKRALFYKTRQLFKSDHYAKSEEHETDSKDFLSLFFSKNFHSN